MLEPGATRPAEIVSQVKLVLEGPPLRRTPSGLLIATPENVAWLLAQADLRARVWWEKANMELCLVPAGEFLMGSPEGEGSSSERPQHTVYLDSYYAGRYPVTVAQFREFVDRSRHSPANGRCLEGSADHSVIYVSWNDVVAYCQWAELRLPTEAEWEKAARGADGRICPWGNQEPDRSLCNYGKNEAGTTLVGKYSPRGDGPYGCADMAGNVWEWCSDWYGADYCAESLSRNPDGPSSGTLRIMRGGSWYNRANYARSAFRYWFGPVGTFNDIGFRCARGSY